MEKKNSLGQQGNSFFAKLTNRMFKLIQHRFPQLNKKILAYGALIHYILISTY